MDYMLLSKSSDHGVKGKPDTHKCEPRGQGKLASHKCDFYLPCLFYNHSYIGHGKES